MTTGSLNVSDFQLTEDRMSNATNKKRLTERRTAQKVHKDVDYSDLITSEPSSATLKELASSVWLLVALIVSEIVC